MAGDRLEYPCMVFVGQKGTRKTDTIMRKFVLPAWKRNRRKVLIVAQALAWTHEQLGLASTSSVQQLERFCKGNNGILVYLLTDLDKRNIKQVYGIIGDHFRNGTIVLEDCTSYVDSSAITAVKNIFINNKNFRCNVFMSYHSIDTPKFVRENTTHFMLHKSVSAMDKNISKYQRYYPTCFDAMYAAWQRVQDHPTQYYHELIETGI